MAFHSISMIAKPDAEGASETLLSLIHFLSRKKIDFFIENHTASLFKCPETIPKISFDQIGHSCDLAIIVGGDGSLLSAARQLGNQSVPLVGINRGKLGFLTDIKPHEAEQKLEAILNGQYYEEQRFMLEASSAKSRMDPSPYTALNEVVLMLDQPTRMLDFEIYIDRVFMSSQRSDGLIVATPTGSTAYALSAGGPILHPALNAVALIPMFPHTLTNRPIVLDANSVLTLRIPEQKNVRPRMVCDSQIAFDIESGEEIYVQKAKQKLRLLHPLDYNYFEALRSKLHWGKRLLTEDND